MGPYFTYQMHHLVRMIKAHGFLPMARICWWRARASLGLIGWEPWLIDLIPQQGRGYLDIGANVGQWVKRLAHSYEYIIAIEPHPKAAAHLRGLNLPPTLLKYEVVEAAACNHNESVTLHLYPASELSTITPNGLIALHGLPYKPLVVPAVTIDSLFLMAVDFIKIDVEGAEWEVLLGSEDTIHRCHPDLLIECHSDGNAQHIWNHLTRLGYEIITRFCPYYQATDPWRYKHLWLKATWGGTIHDPSKTERTPIPSC